MKRLLLLAVVGLTVAAGVGGTALVTGAGQAGATQRGPRVHAARVRTSTDPCGTMALSATSYTHVIWIWMENHSSSAIIGSPQAPYINGLAASCGLATNYHNISHPSLPNYIAATSGLPLSGIQQFSSDCNPSAACSTGAPSIFGQGESWKSYEDSMPTNCDTSSSGPYAVRHNPPPYYTSLRGCSSFDVPFTQLKSDLKSGALPAFSFITPNVDHDMHDGTVAQGNAWLAKAVKKITKSTTYRAGKLVVFITWDEGEGGSSGDCATNTTDVGCHVATLVVSPSTPTGTTSSTLFNHYSLLMTTEQLLGLPLLGSAATSNSMKTAFGL
jgi:phosphatidylinositol-3-phosphatase